MNKLNSPLALMVIGLASLIALVALLAVTDMNFGEPIFEINIQNKSVAVVLLAFVIGTVTIFLTVFALRIMLGDSVCCEHVTAKKFISAKNAIVDGKNGEEIRFKDRDKTVPIDIEIQESALSTSKIIALIGSVAILLLFMGFGSITMVEYLDKGKIPDGQVSKILHLLLGGSVLFIPYIVNKIFETGRNLTKKSRVNH